MYNPEMTLCGAGETLPLGSDGVWLPGGYPELHTEALTANTPLWDALRQHVDEGGYSGGKSWRPEQIVDC